MIAIAEQAEQIEDGREERLLRECLQRLHRAEWRIHQLERVLQQGPPEEAQPRRPRSLVVALVGFDCGQEDFIEERLAQSHPDLELTLHVLLADRRAMKIPASVELVLLSGKHKHSWLDKAQKHVRGLPVLPGRSPSRRIVHVKGIEAAARAVEAWLAEGECP